MARALEPGSVVAARYRLERLLGEGGMGVVWLATHQITRRKVALKLVKRAGDGGQRARLLREARAASAVRHPHVREVYDVFEAEDGSSIMAMEYLAGETLAELLRREGKLSLPETAALLAPVVSAVGAAHALGIVHRDLKPENVFLDQGPPSTVKVLDFGIAKLTAVEGAAAATAALTASGALLGTPHYMSPEQAFGESDVDQRADVWALGLILYRCLSGALPTEADNVGQVFKNIVARPIRPLGQVVPDVPTDVASLVEAMLARDRAERPADLREVAALLARYADVPVPAFDAPALGVTASTSAPAQEGAAAVDPLASTEEGPVPGSTESTLEAQSLDRAPRRGVRAPSWRAAAIAGALLGAIVTGVVWKWSPSPVAVTPTRPEAPGPSSSLPTNGAPAAAASVIAPRAAGTPSAPLSAVPAIAPAVTAAPARLPTRPAPPGSVSGATSTPPASATPAASAGPKTLPVQKDW